MAETPKRSARSELLKRDYSPLLAGAGCISTLVFLGWFVTWLGWATYALLNFLSGSYFASSSMFLWGVVWLSGGFLLIWLTEWIFKLVGISRQEFALMTMTPYISTIHNLVNWRNRIIRKQSDNYQVASARELYAQMKAKALARSVGMSDDESSHPSENDKED